MDRVYGWKKDTPSDKDKLYSVHRAIPSDLPESTSNLLMAPPVVDQGQLGSCTANAIGAALRHDQIKQGVRDHFMPSRLFIYFNERLAEGNKREDSGAQIRTGIKVVAHLGAPPEEVWPYNVIRFKDCPPLKAYSSARAHQSLEYFRIDWRNLREVKACLAAGFGIVFGFQVPEHFESQEVIKSGVLRMPSTSEALVGGHAVYALDYNDHAMFPGWEAPGGVLVQNSWGTDWGISGRFWMPYKYITDPQLSDDFWTIRKVEV